VKEIWSKAFSRILRKDEVKDLCTAVDEGVYRCKPQITILLLEILSYDKSVDEMHPREFVQELKHFLSAITFAGCLTLLVTGIDVESRELTMKRIDKTIQMKKVEYLDDKANMQLKRVIDNLMKIRRKILEGVPLASTRSIIAIICPPSYRELGTESVIRQLRSMSFSLRPLNDISLAENIVKIYHSVKPLKFRRLVSSMLEPSVLMMPASVASNDFLYLGIDLLRHHAIFIDVEKLSSPHILILGSTGSGKSVSLVTLMKRLVAYSNGTGILFDLKGDLEFYLKNLADSTDIYIIGGFNDAKINLCSDYLRESISSSLSNSIGIGLEDIYLVEELIDNACRNNVDIGDIFSEFDQDSKLVQVVTVLKDFFTSGRSTYSFDLGNIPRRTILLISMKSSKSPWIAYPILTSILISYFIKRASLKGSMHRVVLGLDEAWDLFDHVSRKYLESSLRLARWHNVGFIFSTQSLEDLKETAEIVQENVGLMLIHGSASYSYWATTLRHLKLNTVNLLDYIETLNSPGVALVKIGYESFHRLAYIDPID